jgi:hypothetical protein
MSLILDTPANWGNTDGWSEFSHIVIQLTSFGSQPHWVSARNGYRYTVARSKNDGKWWIVDDHEILPRHGPFDTPELAWTTLRLLA